MVHHSPVGHAVEGLRWAYCHHAADPGPGRAIVLNRRTSWRLAELCPWLEATYTVDVPGAAAPVSEELVAEVPRDGWDVVVSHPWSRSDAELDSPGAFYRYYGVAERWLRPRMGFAVAWDGSLPYDPAAVLRFELPAWAREAAAGRLLDTTVRIAVVPVGSRRPERFPSPSSWRAIVDALAERHGDVSFYVIGRTARGAGGTTSAWSAGDLRGLAHHRPDTVDCVDLDLFEQLAVVEACDLLVAPHTGFGFAATAVGTPRLTISGGRWWDRFLNGVPCWSVLPDPERYPCFDDAFMGATPDGGDGLRIASMSRARILGDLDAIGEASEALVAGRWSAEQCAERHWLRLADWARRSPARTDIPLGPEEAVALR